MVAHGASRGERVNTTKAPSGGGSNGTSTRYSFAATRLWPPSVATHGLRRGLPSYAAPQLSSKKEQFNHGWTQMDRNFCLGSLPMNRPLGAPTFLSAWFEELAHADKNVGAPTARFRGSKRESLVRRNLSPKVILAIGIFICVHLWLSVV